MQALLQDAEAAVRRHQQATRAERARLSEAVKQKKKKVTDRPLQVLRSLTAQH